MFHFANAFAEIAVISAIASILASVAATASDYGIYCNGYFVLAQPDSRLSTRGKRRTFSRIRDCFTALCCWPKARTERN